MAHPLPEEACWRAEVTSDKPAGVLQERAEGAGGRYRRVDVGHAMIVAHSAGQAVTHNPAAIAHNADTFGERVFAHAVQHDVHPVGMALLDGRGPVLRSVVDDFV